MVRSGIMLVWLCHALCCCSTMAADRSGDGTALRLVPLPKQVELSPGTFVLREGLKLRVPAEMSRAIHERMKRELQLAQVPVWELTSTGDNIMCFRVGLTGSQEPLPPLAGDAREGSYVLEVNEQEIRCRAADASGLCHGAATLSQLIRANRIGSGLPCLIVRDWPSLKWRCFQDDLTRGPSSTLETLQRHIDLGSDLKMNLFTYYMEYQYAFKKHPRIGPREGSLLPDELTTLVSYAKARQIDILGNQQSFGHFAWILKHPEYADLRETDYLLCPTRDETYQLLDDLYSEVCPLLPFPMFNVCCDETAGLGSGPSQRLAEEIGVGGVYVRHVRRVHDLLRDKYNKRMMMWGDIILQHPDQLDQIPRDTIMLTWGYEPKTSFEDQILPFKESGYEFFVCPGINNWSRILPDFAATTVNIQNFVRDGIRHGAIGMLNTAWEDDGEALQGYKWHGYAWGAECAWNASATSPEDFNRRLGGVLFGEPGDHFGQAIELLSQTHRLPGMGNMLNSRFWQNDFLPRQHPRAARKSAGRLLAVVEPAIEHLEFCRQDAVVNAELLDAFLLGARRMRLIARRILDGLRVAEAYSEAYDTRDPVRRLEVVREVQDVIETTRQAHAELGREFRRIWLSESKPYALDWTTKRYAELDEWYRALGHRVAGAREKVERGGQLPPPAEMGLALPTSFARQTRTHAVVDEPLLPDMPWVEQAASHRIGIAVEAGSVDRYELPVEIDVRMPPQLTTEKSLRAFQLLKNTPPQEILAQHEYKRDSEECRLTLVIPGPVRHGTRAEIHLYCGLPGAPHRLCSSVVTEELGAGMWRLENDAVRLLLGAEGAHVYGWQIKSAGDHDLTMPGTTLWSGFADLGQRHRGALNQLVCTAKGPALVRYVGQDDYGIVKTISLFGGTQWMEVTLSEPVDYYWDFDDPRNFSGDGPTPGTYLFSTGSTGPVGKAADNVAAQVRADGARWVIKWNQQQLALGLAAPEVATRFVVGPGAGAGGVGIEGAQSASHFVTFAGRLQHEPGETMARLTQTLDFTNQPQVTVYGWQGKP